MGRQYGGVVILVEITAVRGAGEGGGAKPACFNKCASSLNQHAPKAHSHSLAASPHPPTLPHRPAGVKADVERSCLILETGVSQRWRYGGWRPSPDSIEEAQGWEEAKEGTRCVVG